MPSPPSWRVTYVVRPTWQESPAIWEPFWASGCGARKISIQPRCEPFPCWLYRFALEPSCPFHCLPSLDHACCLEWPGPIWVSLPRLVSTICVRGFLFLPRQEERREVERICMYWCIWCYRYIIILYWCLESKQWGAMHSYYRYCIRASRQSSAEMQE